jgi:predicted DCC family thiol-disulfide oxidoreductase YuxK
LVSSGAAIAGFYTHPPQHRNPMPSTPAILLYDDCCGFCKWSVARVLDLDSEEKVRPLPIQSEEGQRLLADVEPARRLESWHLAFADGTVLSGGAAAAPLAGLLPRARALAGMLTRAPRLVDGVYRWGAARRGFFGRRLSASAVDRATSRIAQRAAAMTS